MNKRLTRVAKQTLDLMLETKAGERLARTSAKYVSDKYDGATFRKDYYRSLMKETSAKVYSGPYVGMNLISESSWGAVEPSYVLGCYEQEIQSTLVAHDWSRNTAFADIGCANGYHAVGMTKIRRDLDVFAFDIDPNAVEVTKRMAEANSVADRVQTRGEFVPGKAYPELGSRPFFLVDIEGEEANFIPKMLPFYEEADFLIECHDRQDHRIRVELKAVLDASHDIVEIHRQGRSPAIHPAIEQLPDNKAWGILSENRSRSDIWLYCKAGSQ